MQKVIIGVVVAAVLGAAGYALFLYKKQIKEFFAGSPPPAVSPQDALSKFKQALIDRKYKVAVTYCNGPFAAQLSRCLDSAEELGMAIDNLRHIEQTYALTESEDVRKKINTIDPTIILGLASNFDPEVTSETDTSAQATLRIPEGDDIQVELVKDTQGKEPSWKIKVQETKELQANVDEMNKKYKDYVAAINKVKDQIRSKDIGTKDELHIRLFHEIQAAER